MILNNFFNENKQIFNQGINLEELLEDAEQALDKHGFYIAKNLLKLKAYKNCRDEAIKYMGQKLSQKQKFPHSLRGDIAAGMTDTFGYSNSKSWKVYRHCSFTWNKRNPDLQVLLDVSNCISKIRNLLNHNDLDYGVAIEENGYITYTSLSLYPNDGGFLRRHHDGLEYGSDNSNQGKILHFKIELTHLGTDYKEGGFLIKDKESGEMVNISSQALPSDVLFFDGSQQHEVSPTKGGKLGRIAFFQIPTFVSGESRIGLFTGEGWSKPKIAMSLLSNKSLFIFKKTVKKIIALIP